MAQIAVTFTFHSGVQRHLFSNVRLSGSWNAAGQFSEPVDGNADDGFAR